MTRQILGVPTGSGAVSSQVSHAAELSWEILEFQYEVAAFRAGLGSSLADRQGEGSHGAPDPWPSVP